MSPPRVVSLLASGTEIACALGFRDALVGRSHECDFPPAVKTLPQLTAPKFPLDGTSYEIDARVRGIVQEGLSVYRVDGGALRALRPDVIITQVQCEVCAVSLAEVERATADWTGTRPVIVALNPLRLEDVWDDIRRVAKVLDADRTATEVIATLQARLEKIATRSKSLADKPRVAALEWIDPLFAGGNWMPQLIGIAGGLPLFGSPGVHSPVLCWEEITAADPDLVLVVPCGFDLARTRAEMIHLQSRPGWNDLRAVKNRRVFIADGNAYFNRSGPRLVESAETLAEIFHSGAFHFGHEGRAWERIGG